jgi:hypothetical protein
MTGSEVRLTNDLVSVSVIPAEGGRVASLVDLSSERELFFRRTPTPGPRVDYQRSAAGGWEEMFPNDSPYLEYPFHGVLWRSRFEVTDRDTRFVRLEAALDTPQVAVCYEFTLLPGSRRGVRLCVTLNALGDTGPFLWASHPMLAVEPNWIIETNGLPVQVDREWPGRYPIGPCEAVSRNLIVPATSATLNEVVYVDGASEATIRAPDKSVGTHISWDARWLKYLWIVTIANDVDIRLTTLLEPCTSRPFRLDEAVASNAACCLRARENRTWWVEIESVDTTFRGV